MLWMTEGFKHLKCPEQIYKYTTLDYYSADDENVQWRWTN